MFFVIIYNYTKNQKKQYALDVLLTVRNYFSFQTTHFIEGLYNGKRHSSGAFAMQNSSQHIEAAFSKNFSGIAVHH